MHLLESERVDATMQRTLVDRMRYRPLQWNTQAKWRTYRAGEGEPWLGFDAVQSLDGISDEIVMVPLIGHTLGHSGVAVCRDGYWFLPAGNAYFHGDEMDLHHPHRTPGLRFYQWMMEKDGKARLWNQQRLRELKAERSWDLEILCSHDLVEFERTSGRGYDAPPTRAAAPATRTTSTTPPPAMR